jgi:hypothetical protein
MAAMGEEAKFYAEEVHSTFFHVNIIIFLSAQIHQKLKNIRNKFQIVMRVNLTTIARPVLYRRLKRRRLGKWVLYIIIVIVLFLQVKHERCSD